MSGDYDRRARDKKAICENRPLDRSDARFIARKRQTHFLISSCQSFPFLPRLTLSSKLKDKTAGFSYRFAIAGNLSFCFICRRGGGDAAAAARPPVGCNSSGRAGGGNYLLRGSAARNRYLDPACQTIGFPPLTPA